MFGVATIRRLLKNTGIFCRISSVLWGSFAKKTYIWKEPTNRSHPIPRKKDNINDLYECVILQQHLCNLLNLHLTSWPVFREAPRYTVTLLVHHIFQETTLENYCCVTFVKRRLSKNDPESFLKYNFEWFFVCYRVTLSTTHHFNLPSLLRSAFNFLSTTPLPSVVVMNTLANRCTSTPPSAPAHTHSHAHAHTRIHTPPSNATWRDNTSHFIRRSVPRQAPNVTVPQKSAAIHTEIFWGPLKTKKAKHQKNAFSREISFELSSGSCK